MKVFIREPADGETVRGYLPLNREADGAWHAITMRPVATAEAAVEVCIDHLQTSRPRSGRWPRTSRMWSTVYAVCSTTCNACAMVQESATG